MSASLGDFSLRPAVFVVFGITGDLGRKRLIPALFQLYCRGRLPKDFLVFGVARTARSRDEFVHIVREALGAVRPPERVPELVSSFIERCRYNAGLFDDPETYRRIADELGRVDAVLGACSAKLFHLSVAPTQYEIVLRHLACSGLTRACGGENGAAIRVLVEKPFGRDPETAAQLDALLGKLFREEQIFRIDHYLAKEAVQNVLAFRFSNDLFEHLWDRRHIDRVSISLLEDFGVEGRGEFYDAVGALLDVGENHMLQMLALVAMENPGKLDGGRIREERARTLEALRFDDGRTSPFVRGQYEGYRALSGVAPVSETETYFRLTAGVYNRRWRGVPFYFESGKALEATRAEIAVYFKEVASCVCPVSVLPGRQAESHRHENAVIFRFKPREEILVRFWAKVPGLDFRLSPRTLSFSYPDAGGAEAYEKVLYDCIRGDQTLFPSTREVRAAWRFIGPVREALMKTPLRVYQQGSAGPA